LQSIHADGFHWHLHPDATAIFGDGPPPVAEWIRSGLAERVKANDQRTVFRVSLPNGSVYLKRCRVHRPRAWVRELFRPPKAKLEFENAVAIQAHGIATTEPLAWAGAEGHWPGESWLVTRERNAVPFSDWLMRPLPPAERRLLARALASFFAHLHDAGVAHPDPHPGNLLVETDRNGEPTFVLIDLHAVTPGRSVPMAKSESNLVLFNRWFQLRASRTDRLRFWLAYRRARSCNGIERIDAERIEIRTSRSNASFWARRFGRYRTNNREFERVRSSAAAGYVYRTLPTAFVESFFSNPEAPFESPTKKVLKDSRTSTVVEVRIETPSGPFDAILKRFNRKSLLQIAKNAFRPSPATRSWLLGHSLRDRGLPTPLPLLLAHRYRFGMPVVSYLLVEKVPGATGLSEAVAEAEALPPVARRQYFRRLAFDLGRLLRTMHDRHVSHRDLKAPNILLENGQTSTLIDLVGVRAGPAVPYATRVRDLARLNASFLNSPAVSRSDRLRALTAYLGVPPKDGRSWKVWWTALAVATQAKVAKNQRTGRPLA
jgi:tRNA A-37 threonylcarbamoyl transferase component Bud32